MADRRNRTHWIKVALAALATVASVSYCVHTYLGHSRGVPSPGAADMPVAPLTAEQRDAMAKEITSKLDLSIAQLAKLQSLRAQGPPESLEEIETRLKKASEILTPEQMLALRGSLRDALSTGIEQRRQTARKALPPDQYAIWEQRIEEKRREIDDALAGSQ